MSKVISASPLITIRTGDTITVTAGDYRGESGTVICAFRGHVTAQRRDGRAFVVRLADCETSEAAGCRGGLDTTPET